MVKTTKTINALCDMIRPLQVVILFLVPTLISFWTGYNFGISYACVALFYVLCVGWELLLDAVQVYYYLLNGHKKLH